MVGYVAGPGAAPAWLEDAWSARLSRAAAALRRWAWWIAAGMLAVGILGGLAVAQQTQNALYAARDAATAELAVQRAELAAAQTATGRLESRLVLERAAIAGLEQDLASTEGFLK